MKYDIIGDVHGHHDKLVALLDKLGYRERKRVRRHPDRTAIFVGDLIDRGPRQLATVNLVRRMVDAGSAMAIMGNHEFNAIAWATRDPASSRGYLRRHARKGNRKQHKAFLAEVEGTRRHAETVKWFKTLPLWLDLGVIRVVHACWHDEHMGTLLPLMGPGQTLTDDLIVSSSREKDPTFLAVEALCKGLEIDLPRRASFPDKDGKKRTKTRIRWWRGDLSTYREAALVPPDVVSRIPNTPIPASRRVRLERYSGPPVFFGHYWLRGKPEPLARNVACVDYSAGAGGALVAYRWEGEPELREAQFFST